MIRPALLLACCLAPLLLMPAASADPICYGKNPDNSDELCASTFTTARGSHCFLVVLDPPIHGVYEYEVTCTPDAQSVEVCNIPYIAPHPCY